MSSSGERFSRRHSSWKLGHLSTTLSSQALLESSSSWLFGRPRLRQRVCPLLLWIESNLCSWRPSTCCWCPGTSTRNYQIMYAALIRPPILQIGAWTKVLRCIATTNVTAVQANGEKGNDAQRNGKYCDHDNPIPMSGKPERLVSA